VEVRVADAAVVDLNVHVVSIGRAALDLHLLEHAARVN